VKLTSCFILISLFLVGCSGGDKPKEDVPKTAIAFFPEEEYDFGRVSEKRVLEHKFRIDNKGTGPIVISDVETSCGCTVAYWRKDPIAPGDNTAIAVALKAKGKAGSTLRKTVKVFGSFDNSPKILVVRAEVVK